MSRSAVVTIAFCLASCARAELSSDASADPTARAPLRVVRVDRADGPVQGLPEPLVDRFRAGDALFDAVFRESDGLGPLYVRASCSDCHADDGRGPGLVVRMGTVEPGLSPEQLRSLLPLGDMERPYALAGAAPLLLAEAPGLRKSHRLPPAVFGRGYLEAIADSAIEANAARQQASGGVISGRVARLGPESERRIGRFGLKARSVDLDAFAAEALHGDMGLTSPAYPEELTNAAMVRDDAKPGVDVTSEQVELLAEYVRLLALPARTPPGESDGERLFAALECGECHVPSLPTRADYRVSALAGIEAPVYTDLLLHDMGDELSDGVAEGDAGPREWRTAPLLGLRFQPAYLHDGRASSVEEAILMHGGRGSEAAASAAAFSALSAADQRALVAFVQEL